MSSGTIAAIATGAERPAGINIIRISGEKAEDIIRSIFVSAALGETIEPNHMYLGKINGKNFSERAFCVLYKTPKSYTGEDVAEIHCHGGKGVTAAIMRLVLKCGARPAEAGEFTKRAFLNGKLTLSEAEGVAEMINAETEGQVKNAYRLMSGELTKGIERAEEKLVYAAALMEVKMDYPEEISEETDAEAGQIIKEIREEIGKLIKSSERSKIIRNGAEIAIIGIPNAGKSSLLNAILKEDRAIVTPIAGTTRDVLRESVEVDGIRLNFADTAGIRESNDEIEKIGIEKSRAALDGADLIVFLQDATVSETAEIEIAEIIKGKRVIKVVNKTDCKKSEKEGLKICAKTGENVDKLLDEILSALDAEEIISSGALTNERHLAALRECDEHLKNAESSFGIMPSECIAVDLYAAGEALGRITGKNAPDEVIDAVFANFCVGK